MGSCFKYINACLQSSIHSTEQSAIQFEDMASATSTSSESQSLDGWELVDRDAASTVSAWSDFVSDFTTVISQVSDDDTAEGARETYLCALMSRVEPGKAASSIGDAVGTVPGLGHTTSKGSSRSATGRPMDCDDCFRSVLTTA